MKCTRCLATTALAAALATGWGCAPYPAAPPPGGSTAAPAQRTSGSAAARGGGGAGAAITFAPVDTTPSRDALEVLATIPEPVPEAERVPAPEAPPDGATTDAPPLTPPSLETSPADSGATASPSGTTASPSGTTSPASSAAPDSDEAAVPIPSPTYALGLAPPPPPDTTAADSSAMQGAAPSGSRAPASGPPPGLLAGSPPDTCWRVQIGAPKLRAQGQSLREASESLLLVPMVVEHEAGLYKVRVRDCMTRAAAEALKQRAVQTGFKSAVRFGRRR